MFAVCAVAFCQGQFSEIACGFDDIREISDEGMLVCHADIEGGKLSAGDYIVGTGAAEFADTEHFNSWASTTNHVGPRLKRKLVEKKSKSDDSNHHAKIGFAVTREVTSVDRKDANCAFAHTKTIHPLRLFNSYDVHAKFNAVHSEKVQAHRKTQLKLAVRRMDRRRRGTSQA